jgi:hypothetical protein
VKKFNQARVNGGSNYDSQPKGGKSRVVMSRNAIYFFDLLVDLTMVLCLGVRSRDNTRDCADIATHLSNGGVCRPVKAVGGQRQHNLVRGRPRGTACFGIPSDGG